jgi:hypothetical protein
MNLTRRGFLAATGLGAAGAGFGQQRHAIQNRVIEWSLGSGKAYRDPFHEVSLDVVFRGPQGIQHRVPAYWAGENQWRVRYAPAAPGRYTCTTECSDTANRDLHGVATPLEVTPYDGANPLYARGALRVSSDKRYLEHADGTPFFWLGDTWWMALTSRLRWPEDFQWLAADRKRKGFNVIQFVAGLYPDMDSFDPRGMNEAGFPWTENYGTINPAWWDMADLRVQHLVETGLVPCVLGCWGYYLLKIGMEKMKKHWRYIVARWGAYPVVWAMAGEGSMPWYLSETKDQDRAQLVKQWTEVARYVRGIDPHKRIVTVHPSRSARESVDDPRVIDFDMLQTGHGDRKSLPNTVKSVRASYEATPRMPVINGEVCYEGILAHSKDEVQRLMFWACVLSGACGHTYGANGIWQVNLPDKPYGPSPHGNTWGNTPWKEAAQLPGSVHVGVGATILSRYEWWRFEPHPEWVTPHASEKNYEQPYAAGIPGRIRVLYLPSSFNPPTLVGLEAGEWQAVLLNPATGERHALGRVRPEGGQWQPPSHPEVRDWVLAMEK